MKGCVPNTVCSQKCKIYGLVNIGDLMCKSGFVESLPSTIHFNRQMQSSRDVYLQGIVQRRSQETEADVALNCMNITKRERVNGN